MIIQFNIDNKKANLISSISIIYFAVIRNLIEVNFIFLNNDKFVVAAIFSLIVFFTQLEYFKNNIKDYINTTMRLAFCYLSSLLLVMIVFNSIEIYSMFSSIKDDKKSIRLPLVQIKGMVGREYASFEYHGHTISRKIDGELIAEIDRKGIDNYCADIVYYKGLFGFYILDELVISQCNN